MDSPNNVVDDQTQDQVEVQLPGFRFHPTDEELVGFYLQRKVEKKPISIELIKSIDIYKYDPWDLPKASCSGVDKEWYFFCKRGRKYKNSVRPNRVTGSGFWKATGIDKPVLQHSHHLGPLLLIKGNNNNNDNNIIGLKKTLVYYRGSAGKGTKTDWMMHEFRLPATILNCGDGKASNRANSANIDTLQEAEIWTLCRIFKRNVSYRKYTSDWRELSTKRSQHNNMDSSAKKYCNSMATNNNIISTNNRSEANGYIDFSAAPVIYHEEKKPNIINHMIMNNNDHYDRTNNQVLHVSQLSSMAATQHSHNSAINLESSLSSISSVLFTDHENDQLFSTTYSENWDELRAVVEYAIDPSFM